MSTLPVILLLSGSLRVGSTNEAVLRTAQAVAPSVPVEAVLYGGLAGLPHFNPDDDDLEPAHAQFEGHSSKRWTPPSASSRAAWKRCRNAPKWVGIPPSSGWHVNCAWSADHWTKETLHDQSTHGPNDPGRSSRTCGRSARRFTLDGGRRCAVSSGRGARGHRANHHDRIARRRAGSPHDGGPAKTLIRRFHFYTGGPSHQRLTGPSVKGHLTAFALPVLRPAASWDCSHHSPASCRPARPHGRS